MKIYNLLNSAKKWIRGEFATSDDGHIVEPDSPDATRWCILGGVVRCYPLSQRSRIRARLYTALYPKSPHSLGVFNDRATFRQVRARLKKAKV